MSKIKIKLFGEYNEYPNQAATDLQKQLDIWLESDDNINIIDSNISLSESGGILTVKYYESAKRNLILEKQNKEF